MAIIVVGISHKTAPIEVREKFYLRPPERELLLSELKNQPSVVESLVLSTCNRTEIYADMLESRPELLMELLLKVKHMEPSFAINSYFYIHMWTEAIEHLFRVACGLESIILGEEQILGQVKKAVELAQQMQATSRVLNILSNIVICTGKKVRTETQIDKGGSSVSWAALKMAQEKLGDLQGKSILLLGAGKMGGLAIEAMADKGFQHIYVMNRTHEKALAMAVQFGGEAVPFWDIKNVLSRTDICICSTGAPHYVIEEALIRDVMAQREGRPLILIDISMPRNVDPQVSLIPQVALCTVDNLDQVVLDNAQRRLASVIDVERIIARKVEEFYRKVERPSPESTAAEDMKTVRMVAEK